MVAYPREIKVTDIIDRGLRYDMNVMFKSELTIVAIAVQFRRLVTYRCIIASSLKPDMIIGKY